MIYLLVTNSEQYIWPWMWQAPLYWAVSSEDLCRALGCAVGLPVSWATPSDPARDKFLICRTVQLYWPSRSMKCTTWGRAGFSPLQKLGPIVRGGEVGVRVPLPIRSQCGPWPFSKEQRMQRHPPGACRCRASWGAASIPARAGSQPFLQTRFSVWRPCISCLRYVWRVLLGNG